MSVQGEIDRIKGNIADAYAKIAEKGGSVPSQPSSANLAAAVESIPTGGEDLLAARFSNSITSYSSQQVTSVSQYGFSYQTNLISVSLPACTSFETGAFYGCTSLSNLYAPKLQSISYQTFRNCSSLMEFISGDDFDSRIDASAFEGCDNIAKIDLRHVTTLGFSPYSLACNSLTALIVRNDDFVPPFGSNVFGLATTAMNQGNGYIYVPASMVNAYKEAANWSKYADQIRAIEDYPEICGT